MRILVCRIESHSGRFFFKQAPFGATHTIVPEDVNRLKSIESRVVRKIIRIKYEINQQEKTFFEVDLI
jgi:hypothetical protein